VYSKQNFLFVKSDNKLVVGQIEIKCCIPSFARDMTRSGNQMETPLSLTHILEILGVAAILYLIGSLRVLRQYERGVVFLLGKFEGVRGPGLTLIFVPVQQMVRVSLRTVTMQIPLQKIITKDNVSIDIAAVAYYHISDPENAVIVIENVYNAINQISQTTVRPVCSASPCSGTHSTSSGFGFSPENGQICARWIAGRNHLAFFL
jgi:SPFH domain / Band 7 family